MITGFTGMTQVESTVGLENLTKVNGDLIVSRTDLQDLSGFSGLTEVTGDVIITNNRQLTNYCGLKKLLETGIIGGELIIENNLESIDLTGCNTEPEDLIVYPVPSSDYVYIRSSKGFLTLQSIAIYDPKGALVYEEDVIDINNIIVLDIANLLDGGYYLKINTLDKVIYQQIVKY